MKFFSALVVAMASVAIAKDANKTDGTSTKSQCNQVSKLTKLVDIAGNSTKLDKVTKGNATKAADIQAKASQASTKLTELQSNATLMTACDQIFAVQDTEDACDKMQGLQKLNALIANQTALDAKTKGNTTKADAIKAKAQEKAADLTAMEANTTLTSFCAGLSDKQSCKSMAKLAKEQEFAANTTALVSSHSYQVVFGLPLSLLTQPGTEREVQRRRRQDLQVPGQADQQGGQGQRPHEQHHPHGHLQQPRNHNCLHHHRCLHFIWLHRQQEERGCQHQRSRRRTRPGPRLRLCLRRGHAVDARKFGKFGSGVRALMSEFGVGDVIRSSCLKT